MARRRRRREPGAETAPEPGGKPGAEGRRAPVDPDVARFAQRLQASKDAERAAQRAARDDRRRQDEHARLVSAKDAAAAQVRAVRARPSPSADDVQAAEAAYRAALGALVASETGQQPAWAPPPAAPDDADTDDADTDDTATVTTESTVTDDTDDTDDTVTDVTDNAVTDDGEGTEKAEDVSAPPGATVADATAPPPADAEPNPGPAPEP
jgi:hypothetical protein